MARIPWVISDPNTSESYAFEINPNDDGSLQYEKTVVYRNTSADTGRTVIFEGRDAPASTQFSGTVLTEDQYNQMVFWFNKRGMLLLEDDLGREFNIYIIKFSPKRRLSRTYPWRHDYTVEYFIVV